MTTKWRQWLTSLVSAQPTHKSGPTISTHTTQTQMTYLINKASHALSDMLWRQKGSWHRMKKTSQALHKILGLCYLWTPGLGNRTSLTLLLPLHTKRMSIIHLYLIFYFPPLHLYPQKRAKLSELSPCETGCPLRGQTAQLLYRIKIK